MADRMEPRHTKFKRKLLSRVFKNTANSYLYQQIIVSGMF